MLFSDKVVVFGQNSGNHFCPNPTTFARIQPLLPEYYHFFPNTTTFPENNHLYQSTTTFTLIQPLLPEFYHFCPNTTTLPKYNHFARIQPLLLEYNHFSRMQPLLPEYNNFSRRILLLPENNHFCPNTTTEGFLFDRPADSFALFLAVYNSVLNLNFSRRL